MQYFIELFVILTFFVIPPIFVSSTPTLGFVEFNIFQIITYGFLAVYSFFRGKILLKNDSNEFPKIKTITSNKKKILLSLLIFAFLFLNGLFWQTVSKSSFEKIGISKTLLSHIFQIIGIFIYAFYEETMYRNFLQVLLSKFFYVISPKQDFSKINFILSELIALLLFSLGHLYMGFFAVLNSFFAGITLRFLVLKTKSVFPSSFVHFFYNLILYILLFV